MPTNKGTPRSGLTKLTIPDKFDCNTCSDTFEDLTSPDAHHLRNAERSQTSKHKKSAEGARPREAAATGVRGSPEKFENACRTPGAHGGPGGEPHGKFFSFVQHHKGQAVAQPLAQHATGAEGSRSRAGAVAFVQSGEPDMIARE